MLTCYFRDEWGSHNIESLCVNGRIYFKYISNKEVVYKKLNELIWLPVASNCGHDDESTDNT